MEFVQRWQKPIGGRWEVVVVHQDIEGAMVAGSIHPADADARISRTATARTAEIMGVDCGQITKISTGATNVPRAFVGLGPYDGRAAWPGDGIIVNPAQEQRQRHDTGRVC
jgi:hypothetical protein